jgi:hypothetical protein
MFTAGQVPVSGTATPVRVTLVPPGPGQLILSTSGGTILVGLGTTLSAANGMPVPNGFWCRTDLYQGGGGGTLYAINTAAGTAGLGFIVSAPSFQTGP